MEIDKKDVTPEEAIDFARELILKDSGLDLSNFSMNEIDVLVENILFYRQVRFIHELKKYRAQRAQNGAQIQGHTA